MPQRHGHGLESAFAKGGERGVEPGPGQLEHRAHRHPHGPAVERVAAVGGEQRAVYAKGRGGTEDGPDVRGVAHRVEDDDAARLPAQLLPRGLLWPPHGAEHAARQRVASERGEKLATAGVDRYVTATLDDVGGIAFDMARLAEQGYGQETLVESHVDDLGAFGYHRAVFGMEAVAELVIGQTVVDGHSSGV